MDLQFYIGFTKTKGLYSRVISFITKEDVTHSFIGYKDLTLHAVGSRTIIKSLDNTLKKANNVQLVPLPALKPKATCVTLERLKDAYFSKPYDWLSILGLGWVLLIRKVTFNKVTLTNPFATNDERQGYFCSEECVDFLQNIFPDQEINEIFKNVDQNITTPGTLKKILLENGFNFTYIK